MVPANAAAGSAHRSSAELGPKEHFFLELYNYRISVAAARLLNEQGAAIPACVCNQA